MLERIKKALGMTMESEEAMEAINTLLQEAQFDDSLSIYKINPARVSGKMDLIKRLLNNYGPKKLKENAMICSDKGFLWIDVKAAYIACTGSKVETLNDIARYDKVIKGCYSIGNYDHYKILKQSLISKFVEFVASITEVNCAPIYDLPEMAKQIEKVTSV